MLSAVLLVASTPLIILFSVRLKIADGFRSVLGLFLSKCQPAAVPQLGSNKDIPQQQWQDPPPVKLDARLKEYKILHHKLHNLEMHSDILPKARSVLLSLFGETISPTPRSPEDGDGPSSILTLDSFSRDALTTWVRGQEDSVLRQLTEYNQRRLHGGPAELFQSADEAKAWLLSQAPSKLVDGVWVSNIHRACTPFELRHVTKNAWQVFSEEVGDGDVSKNHAAIYRDLLKRLGVGHTEPGSLEFSRAPGMDNVGIWRSALAQMLISVFSHEFMAETLGFNLHFEMLTYETARAAVELREFGIDSYYFLLHMSIDNSDSGHAKMALEAVIDYLEHVGATQGEVALQAAWRGVKIGYLLSVGRGQDQESQENGNSSSVINVNNEFASKVVRIFQAKASVAAKLHCTSRVRIGHQKLSDWMEEGSLGQPDFLESLARAKPWIVPGSAKQSKLVTALKWNGKMFGAFTMGELDVLCNWIAALQQQQQPESASAYWRFLGCKARAAMTPDVRINPTVFEACGLTAPWREYMGVTNRAENILQTKGIILDAANIGRLLPLWFAHLSLLESLVCIPIQTCDALGSAVVSTLRAQRGFAAEGDGVAGTDESRREQAGLLELGLEMAQRAGIPRPTTLASVVGRQDKFPLDMLHWSMRPLQHRVALVGMAWAFLSLHEHLASEHVKSHLLSNASRARLRAIVARERQALQGLLLEGTDEFEAAVAYAHAKIAESLAAA